MSSFSTKSLCTSQGNSSVSSISAARASPIRSSTISRTRPRNSSSSSGRAKGLSATAASGQPADDQGVALAATPAQGRATEVNTAPPHLVHQREGQPAPAHPDGVPQGDCSTVHVDDLVVHPEHPRGVQRYRGERLVDLHQPEVVGVLAG